MTQIITEIICQIICYFLNKLYIINKTYNLVKGLVFSYFLISVSCLIMIIVQTSPDVIVSFCVCFFFSVEEIWKTDCSSLGDTTIYIPDPKTRIDLQRAVLTLGVSISDDYQVLSYGWTIFFAFLWATHHLMTLFSIKFSAVMWYE